MIFKKRKAPPQRAAEQQAMIKPLPFYQTCRKLNIANSNDFGVMHEEHYDGLFCNEPWARISFSVPCSDWSEFQKSSHYQSLASFLSGVRTQNLQIPTSNLEDLRACVYYKSAHDQ